MNKNLKCYFVLLIIFISFLPYTLNLWGIDFSSTSTPLSFLGESTVIGNDQQFYALTGALHHALLEWSAVILAIIAGVGAFVHYYQNKDISIPIIGLALLCAGLTDAFHTLAATRIISATVPNSDFIPFTWAFSRLFNASIMILGVLLSLWLTRPSNMSVNEAGYAAIFNSSINKSQTLLIISVFFITLAISAVILAATSQHLPQTTFKNAFITRPYDVVPLALFILSAVLVWFWYQRKASILKFSLLLSLIPGIITQLHMSLGSTELFDNHFNIAHFLKVVAYAVITLGILITLVQSSKAEESENENLHEEATNKLSNTVIETSKLLDVGKVRYSQVLVFSSFTFLLAIAVSILVSSIHYIDAVKIAQEQQALLVEIATIRNRSIQIGVALAIIALAIAIIMSRRLSSALQSITTQVTHYSHTGEVTNFPIHAQDEIGVLARSFHNLLITQAAQEKSLLQQQRALDEHAIVSITDIKGNITYFNDKFMQISGYSEGELLGKNHRILNSGQHDKAFFTQMYQTISQGKTWQGDICNKAKDGHFYWVNTTIVPFMNNKGRPENYISIRTDITSNKHNSEQLLSAKVELSEQVSKLESANVELNQFAYVASHDLKSPLNGISQLVSWLEEDCHEILPEESQEHLKLLKNRSKRMIALLNDLLDYSRAGRTDYQVEVFNLADVVNDIFDLHGNKVSFSCKVQDITLSMQKAPFELIIRNLISNAIKHHDKAEGTIEISVEKSQELEQNYYVIRIQDDGPGIPVNLHEKALEMFQTLQSRDKVEGSGMGLALVKKTVQHHGGTISIDPSENRGTLIIVKWPYIQAIE